MYHASIIQYPLRLSVRLYIKIGEISNIAIDTATKFIALSAL